MKQENITPLIFLKKYLASFFLNVVVSAMTALGFILSLAIYYFLSLFNLEQNISIIISISITLFMISVYSAYQIVKDIIIDSAAKEKAIEKQKEEADVYCDMKKNQAATFLNTAMIELKQIIAEENISKPFLAQIYADYIYYLDMKISEALKYKRNPAYKASDEIKKIAKEKKDLNIQLKILRNQLSVYENAFPWLEEFKEISTEDLKELVIKGDHLEETEYDTLKKYLSPEEYKKLPAADKYQLALNRYRNNNKKTNWQVGIDFERYIGYTYEKNGYKVRYNGALEKLEDLGRDLIAINKNEIVVVQCKYWNKQKTIHEKHIFQLYGTMIMLSIDNPKKNIRGEFVTTTNLSDTAKKVAQQLKIKVIENADYEKDYPCIKCNISRKDNSKIYHLPFDQQYDKIDIELNRGEFYAKTILEAESRGFRRAFKWVSKS